MIMAKYKNRINSAHSIRLHARANDNAQLLKYFAISDTRTLNFMAQMMTPYIARLRQYRGYNRLPLKAICIGETAIITNGAGEIEFVVDELPLKLASTRN